jgi:hypothetical protein
MSHKEDEKTTSLRGFGVFWVSLGSRGQGCKGLEAVGVEYLRVLHPIPGAGELGVLSFVSRRIVTLHP